MFAKERAGPHPEAAAPASFELSCICRSERLPFVGQPSRLYYVAPNVQYLMFVQRCLTASAGESAEGGASPAVKPPNALGTGSRADMPPSKGMAIDLPSTLADSDSDGEDPEEVGALRPLDRQARPLLIWIERTCVRVVHAQLQDLGSLIASLCSALSSNSG